MKLPEPETEAEPAMQSIGGSARAAAKLTPTERSEIARRAAVARWSKA